MAVTYRDDPYPAFNFEVVVNGISDDGRSVKGSFMEGSGLGVEIPAIEYRTGSEDITVRKIPGLKKFSNIVLKRGIIGDLTFWKWLLEARNGRVRRAGGSIILLGESRNEVRRGGRPRGARRCLAGRCRAARPLGSAGPRSSWILCSTAACFSSRSRTSATGRPSPCASSSARASWASEAPRRFPLCPSFTTSSSSLPRRGARGRRGG